MEQDLTFFAAAGLTSTSANHIANLAKEYVQAQSQELENVEFYNSFLTIIGSDKQQRVQRGWDKQQIEGIADQLRKISLANSLIAWLREAIKTRTQMLSDSHNMTIEEYCKQNNITMPEKPELPHSLTREEHHTHTHTHTHTPHAATLAHTRGTPGHTLHKRPCTHSLTRG